MTDSSSRPALPDPYTGRILCARHSPDLQSRLTRWIQIFQAFDRIGSPAMPYISAWETGSRAIWYEYVSQRFAVMLQCGLSGIERVFQESIRERRVYLQNISEGDIGERVWSSGQIQADRADLRREVQEAGLVEAVYKIEPSAGKIFWLKDSATVVPFVEDGVTLSLGNLTNVSKEMEQEEALKITKEALRVSEQKYRYQASHDSLTDLYNTRYLYTTLPRLKEESASGGTGFSLIFFDIDNFKKVVDRHGHLHASRVIQEVARTIGQVIEPPAFGVAYAGDEFVVVLPNTGKNAAVSIADKIRDRIRETEYLQSQGLCVKIQASFGVAAYPGDAVDLTRLLSKADKAMFSVKETGKDRVATV